MVCSLPSRRKTTMAYTLVQHSGCGYGGKSGFARAVETRPLDKRQETAVRKVGGLVIPTLELANRIVEDVNYPPEVQGLYPCCRGTFSIKEVDQLKIYLPTEYCRGMLTVMEVMQS